MIDLNNIEDLQATEKEIDGTTFTFGKLTAMKGWEWVLLVREEVGKVVPAGLPPLMALDKAILLLPTPFVLRLQGAMFEKVEFANARTTLQQLQGAEDTAFADSNPGAVFEVLIRSLAVNFSDSFREIIDQIFTTREKAPTRRKSPKA